MRHIFLALLLALPLDASAGKLADGWKGLPYGPDTVLATPPLPGCTKNPEDAVRWSCEDQIGDASLTVAYMADEGLFFGVIARCTGFTSCSALRDILGQAWGAGRAANEYSSGSLPDWTWTDGDVWASWEWNRFSDKGRVIISHHVLYQQIKAVAEARARKAAEGL